MLYRISLPQVHINFDMLSERQTVLDSFLSAYFITVIIAALGCNLIILTALRKLLEQHAYYVGLTVMCVFALLASSILLPSALVVVADRTVIRAENNLYFCQFLGGFSLFLHRASTFSFCMAHVDRYVLIRRPMAFTSFHRLAFSVTCILANVILAAIVAVVPFFIAQNGTPANIPPTNTPFCFFVPHSQAGKNLLLVDTIFSYVIVWSIFGYTIVGMLAVACFVGSGRPKVSPISYHKFPKGLPDQRRKLPEAWCQKPSNAIARNRTAAFQNRNQKIKVNPRIKTKPIKANEDEVLGTSSNKWETISNISYAEEPNSDSAITNVIFNDEVTLRNDGTTHWRSSAVAAVKSRHLPVAVQRELTLQEVDIKRPEGTTKICLSSFVKDDTTESDRSVVRQSVRQKFAKLRTQARMHVIQNKQNTRHRFNTKAFVNLTLTIAMFTLLVFPVTSLQFYLALSKGNTKEINIFWLETLVSISFSLIYVAFPVMTAIADKEIKRTIVKMFRTICDDHEASDDLLEPQVLREARK